MCPVASGKGSQKYAWQDHDAAQVVEVPPTLNQWYTVFNETDVRLLWFTILQQNDETDDKHIEVRWTVDGNIYLIDVTLPNSVARWIYKNSFSIAHPIGPLTVVDVITNAAFYVAKHGHSFKAEVRIITAAGTNQVLFASAVYETLEAT